MKTQYALLLTLLIVATATADIYQYKDCDGNGTLLLTELDAGPGVDLFELYLGCADLSYANLIYATLRYTDLSYAKLRYANLYGAYMHFADLRYADLTGAYMYFAELSGANLTNANLSGADLNYAYLTNADLTGADLTGAYNWESATWKGATYNDATIFPEGMDPEKFGMINDDPPDDPPVEIDGACCVTSGCDVVEETMCTNFGGTWTEAGSCDDCVTPPETCDADLDNNGEVNIDDLLLLIGAWGVCP